MTAEDIGLGTGIFGEIARLTLTVDGGSAPDSIVAKMPCAEQANLDVALALGLYERELKMFEEVLGRSSLRYPDCHLALRGEGGHFVLLLEDLSVDYDVGDQIAGATAKEAGPIIDALAAFHAQWWEDPALLAMDWLPAPDAPAYMAAVPDIYAAGLPLLESEWADRVPVESIKIAKDIQPRLEHLMVRTASGPVTLIHSDPRLDNIFFAKDGSDDVAFIDFQLALKGRGVADIAYLVGTSVLRDEAAEQWEPLLRRWYDRICDLGITNYSYDGAVTNYKEAALFYVCGAMALIGTFDAGNERGAALVEAYSTRILNHVVDIDAASSI